MNKLLDCSISAICHSMWLIIPCGKRLLECSDLYIPHQTEYISGHFLGGVHEKLTMKMKRELKGKDVVMMQDSWSYIHNAPVIATSLQAEGSVYFLSAVDVGTNKKTAGYCTSVAHDAMTVAEEDYGRKVIGLVTSNEIKMGVMKQNLKEPIQISPTHWLNLLGQEITPSQVINKSLK